MASLPSSSDPVAAVAAEEAADLPSPGTGATIISPQPLGPPSRQEPLPPPEAVAAKPPAAPAPVYPVTIEPALKPGDAAAVAALGARTFAEAFGAGVPPHDLATYLASTYTAEAFEREFLDPAIVTLVARRTRTRTRASRDDAADDDDDDDAAETGAIAGIVQLVRGGGGGGAGDGDNSARHAQLRRLFVDSGCHGGGVGTRLIAAVEGRAREEGFAKLHLGVFVENTRALGLYERLGYVQVGGFEFPTGSYRKAALALVKDL
ncbi:acetyltransferase [Xylariomycetidae sp. FL2044]|nr:acetyltransferase [Xylariomycetidae sp. FL2044]